jgi:hypothetical protein
VKYFYLQPTTYPCDGSGVPGADCLWFTAGFETLESEAERLSESSSPPDPPLFLKCTKEILLTYTATYYSLSKLPLQECKNNVFMP